MSIIGSNLSKVKQNQGFEQDSNISQKFEKSYFCQKWESEEKRYLVEVYSDQKYIVTATGELFDDLLEAFKVAVEIENDHTQYFFYRLYKTIQYLKENLNGTEFSLLGTFLADYIFVNGVFWSLGQLNSGNPRFTPPKKVLRFSGQEMQIYGLDLILKSRLNDLGAFAHSKSISRCSTAGLWLYEDDQALTASYNLPCRKPSCPYCSHLVKEKGSDVKDRSQAISERGKKHLRYCVVGGAVSHYGRMIFTLPEIIQERIDRKDLKDWEQYGDVQVYGTKIERELYEIRKALQTVDISDKKKRKLKKAVLYNKAYRKKGYLEELEYWSGLLDKLKQERRRLRKEKPVGYTVALKPIREKIKNLKRKIARRSGTLEKGRIKLNDLQKAVYEFMQQELGVQGSLETPHLTGEKTGAKGKLHLHFHTLFPLFGNEFGFDWSKGQPFLGNLEEVNLRWKRFLESRFRVKIEGDVANPQYKYVSADGKNLKNVAKLAFWVRYDHRIEAGGAWFPIMANDKDACRVLRMTTRQRYTRGYGVLGDRNLKAFQEENGGKLLKDVLIEMGDKELKQIEGKWQVLTKERLSQDVPFVAFIRQDRRDRIETNMIKEGVVNLPVEVETESDDIVFVHYSSRQPTEKMIETAFQICFFHEELNVWSEWQKTKNGEFDLKRVFGKLPKTAKEEGNGFFIWNAAIHEVATETEQKIDRVFESGFGLGKRKRGRMKRRFIPSESLRVIEKAAVT